MILHRLWARARAFQREQGGNTVLSFAVVFPVIVLAVFGSAALVQILWLKMMFSSGVYDAVQHIAYAGGTVPRDRWESTFATDTKEVVRTRLPHGNFLTQFVPGDPEANSVAVTIGLPAPNGRRYPCDGATQEALNPETLKFSVTATLDLSPVRAIPFLGNVAPFTLTEHASGYLDCPRWTLPEGLRREGCVFPGLPFFCPQN